MKTKKLIIALLVFTVIGAGIFYFLTMGNIGTRYNTVEVKIGKIGKYVQDVGRISSKNIRRYYGLGGSKVDEMTLKIGDHVEKGQLLIKYENNLELEIRRVEKQIEALEAVYRQALLGEDSEKIDSARIEVWRLENNLELALKKKERSENLYKTGAESLAEFEQTVNNVDQLQSSLEIAQNTYTHLSKGISANDIKKYEAEIDVLKLTLKILEKSREDYVVYADIDGVVTELNTFKGETPSSASLVIEIQDPLEKVILVDFMVEDAVKIKANMSAEIQDGSLGIDTGNLKVNKVYPKAFISLSELSVEENRQTVEIALSKTSESLAFGLEVETKIRIEESREVPLVPLGAVFQKKSKEYVKLLKDGKVSEREITTGVEMDKSIEVKEGLKEGELVILNYQD